MSRVCQVEGLRERQGVLGSLWFGTAVVAEEGGEAGDEPEHVNGVRSQARGRGSLSFD